MLVSLRRLVVEASVLAYNFLLSLVNHLRTDDEILVKIFISTGEMTKYSQSGRPIYRSKALFNGLKQRARKNLAALI